MFAMNQYQEEITQIEPVIPLNKIETNHHD